MTTTSIHSLFLIGKDEFAKQLGNYSLPKDSIKVQSMIAEYLNQLLDSKGDFRNSLSESEDYILQATINLLEQQHSLYFSIVSTMKDNASNASVENSALSVSCKDTSAVLGSPVLSGVASLANKDAAITIAGTALGGAVGTFFGSWGAVLGAVAGTAISYYCFVNNNKKNYRPSPVNTVQNVKIDVEAFLSIMSSICESIDALIETYRVQVQKVRNVYENQERSNLQNDFSILLKNILELNKVYNINKESVPTKVSNAIEILFDSLENYDIKIEDGKITKV